MKKSYSKYLQREIPGISPEKMGKVFGPPMNPMNALPFTEKTKLLEADYQNDEIGYCAMFDGTGYVADINFIPGATVEMVDWYFAWRGLEPERYQILDPKNNLAAMTMQTRKTKDPDLTYQEKYWDSTQTIAKKAFFGPPKETFFNYKCPSDVGFLMEKIGDDRSLICIRAYEKGMPPQAGPDYFITHLVSAKDGGVEIRTKIWDGWTIRYGQDFKALPDGFRMTPVFPQPLLIANAAEWASLAPILPQLYAEEKDNF